MKRDKLKLELRDSHKSQYSYKKLLLTTIFHSHQHPDKVIGTIKSQLKYNHKARRKATKKPNYFFN